MKGRLKEFSLLLRRWLPVALWAGFVLYASTSVGSGANSGHYLRRILAWIYPDFALTSLPEMNFFVRKTAHVIQFIVYSLLLWRGLSLHPPIVLRTRALLAWVLGSAAFLAFLSEGIQIFSPLRTAAFGDVWLDISGAVIGVGLLVAVRALTRRPDKSKPRLEAGKERPAGKILITSDLHLDSTDDRGRGTLDRVGAGFLCTNADVLLVAGDFGVAERAHESMAGLRKAAGEEATVVICLGNHDHWLQSEAGGCLSPEDVREKFWRPACQAHRIHCLDFENVSLPGLTLCGGYAGYDFGFKDPDVVSDAKRPTFSDYQKGRFCGLIYPDMDRIPGLAAAEEATRQAKAISRRLSTACDEGTPVLFVSHTIPFASLNTPDSPRGSLARFFDAYSGNSAIGSLLSAMAPSVVLAVSGHTHRQTPVLRIHGVPCVNTGSGPDHLRLLLFDLANMSVDPWHQELPEQEALTTVA